MAADKQTALPPISARVITAVTQFLYWLFQVQNHQPLIEVDTSGGNQTRALPPAGLSNTATGQSAQNQELIYAKAGADGNQLTVTGAVNGAQSTTAAYGVMRFKSNGTIWYRV